jgi:2-iminobutanoate/2-iminopropanoate deaminase
MNNRQRIQTDNAPAAIGPYSQAIRVGNFVYTAGQVGLAPATGELVAGGIKEQTQQALANIAAVLDAAGCSPSDVVKTTVFIMDMADFAAMNEVYAGVFGVDSPPARSTVQVAGLPRGARVEIECVAFLGGGE